jgi:hypothetical protein
MDEIEDARPDGNGNYQRITVTVDCQDNNIDAITYVGTQPGKARFAARPPEEQQVSIEYFSHLEAGATKFVFPRDYYDYLRPKVGLRRGLPQR